MTDRPKGSRNTIVGNVGHTFEGDDNTIIGATDANGNVILNSPMSLGSGANGGQHGIAIGYNAGPREPGKKD